MLQATDSRGASYLLRIPINVFSFEPSLFVSSGVSTVGVVVVDDAMAVYSVARLV